MSVTTSGPIFQDPEDQLLTEIQHLVDAAIQGVCEDHYAAGAIIGAAPLRETLSAGGLIAEGLQCRKETRGLAAI